MKMSVEIKSGEELSLSDVLYDGVCGNCEEGLLEEDFQFRPDPDGSTYRIRCENCGQRYLASVSKVKIV